MNYFDDNPALWDYRQEADPRARWNDMGDMLPPRRRAQEMEDDYADAI